MRSKRGEIIPRYPAVTLVLYFGYEQTILSKGITDEEIASMTDIPLERIRQVAANV